MLKSIWAFADPYIAALLLTVLLASVLPCRGGTADAFHDLTAAAITLLFFLHGAKLSRNAIMAGLTHWRLHATVLGTTFLVFPLLGLGIALLPGIDPVIGRGMLFLTLLPSTVQSSIAFTSIARGNVPAAVCSASFSNFVGIIVTPILVAVLIGRSSGSTNALASVQTIASQLLLPFVVGHLLRPKVGDLIARHRQLVTSVDRGSILLVVYTAFSAAVIEGIWRSVSASDLTIIATLCTLLLVVVLGFTSISGRLSGFRQPDRIVLQFCGSKKSLASGVPMAGVLFPAALVGPMILPLMIFHQFQLVVCAVLARRYAANSDHPEQTSLR